MWQLQTWFSLFNHIYNECLIFQTVSSACALAKHRKANNIEVDDVKVMLFPAIVLDKIDVLPVNKTALVGRIDFLL